MEPDDLDARIARVRALREHHDSPAPESGVDAGIPSAMSFGLNAGAQFVSAVAIGGAVGWLLDRWLGTRPFGMLVLLVLFFVAALVNVWRTMSRAVSVATVAAQAGNSPEAAGNRVTDESDENRKPS